MAIQAQTGWLWTSDEKRWIKTWNRQVQAQSKWLTEQVNHFQNRLPAFSDEAVTSAQPLLRTGPGVAHVGG